MKQILAVAELDFRRLSLTLTSLGLVSGLAPALASGLGETLAPGPLLAMNLVAAGLVTGGLLGADFSEGRSSFFFARPLGMPSFLLGRLAATFGLAALASLALLGSYWLSSPEPALPRVSFENLIRALQFVLNGWAIALYFSLAVATRDRSLGAWARPRAVLASVLRIGGALFAFVLVFGLFADLVVRAYLASFGLIRSFLESWFFAAAAASSLAIWTGRTERMRIARTQNLVMFSYAAFACVAVAGVWEYTLNPGPPAIRRVQYAVPSPGGSLVFVRAWVDRGDGTTFVPVFVVDPVSGATRLLPADPGQGPWLSANGETMAWVEGAPFFFRPLLAMVGHTIGFKVQTGSGPVEDVPMPRGLQARLKALDFFTRLGWFKGVFPSDRGDMFAVLWDRNLTFVTRSGAQLSQIDLGRQEVAAGAFAPSGKLRVALAPTTGVEAPLEFVDIDPSTGARSLLAEAGRGMVRLDRGAARALVVSRSGGAQDSIVLIDFRAASSPAAPRTLLDKQSRLFALFMADGRIAASRGGSEGGLTIFSESGERIRDIPAEAGATVGVRGEPFPGVLAVQSFREFGAFDLTLVDSANGAVLRRFPSSLFPGPWFGGVSGSGQAPPPGAPAARLLQKDGALHELPSLTEEPRLLLPLASR